MASSRRSDTVLAILGGAIGAAAAAAALVWVFLRFLTAPKRAPRSLPSAEVDPRVNTLPQT